LFSLWDSSLSIVYSGKIWVNSVVFVNGKKIGRCSKDNWNLEIFEKSQK
jgi:hypothetical protein